MREPREGRRVGGRAPAQELRGGLLLRREALLPLDGSLPRLPLARARARRRRPGLPPRPLSEPVGVRGTASKHQVRSVPCTEERRCNTLGKHASPAC